MCGIVGATCERNVYKILIEGLNRLEYRGYDSAGLSILDANQVLQTRKTYGKVADLKALCKTDFAVGNSGIAHTRWATHGEPSSINSHPHVSFGISVVHNGIIENHDVLRDELRDDNYAIVSDTDTEVIAHLVHRYLQEVNDLQQAVSKTIARLEGAYAIGVMSQDYPNLIIGARSGSPLVVGVGIDEHYIA